MEDNLFSSPQELDLDRAKREAWIEAYLTQSLTPERAQQLEDFYFQSDAAAERVAEMVQLQACLASRSRNQERRNRHRSGKSGRSRSRSSPLAYLPFAVLAVGVLCMLFFLGRAFWPGAATQAPKKVPVAAAAPGEVDALQKSVPALSANPQQAPNELQQLSQFRPPPFPIVSSKEGRAGTPSDDDFRRTMDKYLIASDYCTAAVDFERMAISETVEFYAAASQLLCGRKAVAVPRLRKIGRSETSIYAEEALLLVAKSELQAYNYAMATRELLAARALDGPNQAEISRILKLLGEK